MSLTPGPQKSGSCTPGAAPTQRSQRGLHLHRHHSDSLCYGLLSVWFASLFCLWFQKPCVLATALSFIIVRQGMDLIGLDTHLMK